MATIDDELAQSITLALQRSELAIKNLDKVVYGPGNVTIEKIDGTQQTGPSWPQMILNNGNPINFKGSLPDTANLNTYGASSQGIWFKDIATGATIANNFPIEGDIGFLEILPTGQYGCTQRYTSRNGNIFIRSLSGTWNGTNGPWSAWQSVQMASRPLASTTDLNSLGDPGSTGLWHNSSSTVATIAKNYPIAGGIGQGILEVFQGGKFGISQRYTTSEGRIFVRSLSANWNGTNGPWGDWYEVASLSSDSTIDAGISLTDYAYFRQNCTYALSGARNDLPVGVNGSAVLMSLRRSGGTVGALHQILFTTTGFYQRTGATNLASNWTSVTWYAGGDSNGWKLIGNDAINALGLGLSNMTALSAMDWNQFDFVSGQEFSVAANNMTNTPTGVDTTGWGSTPVCFNVIGVDGPIITAECWLSHVTNSLFRRYQVRISGSKGSRIFAVRQIWTSADVIPLANGGTGATTPAGARTNLGFDAMGFGLTTLPTVNNVDWQQVDFLTNGLYVFNSANWTNAPAGLVFAANQVVFVEVISCVSSGTVIELILTANASADANFYKYELRIANAKGSRTFSLRKIFTSADTLPIANGGTGAATPAAARTALGFDALGIGVSANILSSLDWQNFDFIPGALYVVLSGNMTNVPTGMDVPGTTYNTLLRVNGTEGGTRHVEVIYSTTGAAAYRYYQVRVGGLAGSRTFTVRKVFTNVDVGVSAGTLAAGDDSRLVNAASTKGSSYTGVIDFINSNNSGDPGEAVIVRAAHGQTNGSEFVNNLAKIFANDGAFTRFQHRVTTYHAARIVVAPATGGAATFEFAQTGNAVASGSWVNAGCDERIKNGITPIENPRDIVMDIRAATWQYRHKGAEGRFGIGVIANDIAKHFPDAVINTGSRELDDGTVIDDVLAVEAGDSGAMVAVHHAVLQSLIEENKSQQNEINDLKSDIENLKKLVNQLLSK